MIPFQIPDPYVQRVAAGVLERCGTFLRDSATKRIVAHLQETSWWQGTLENLLGATPGPGTVMQGARLASSLASNYQLHVVQGQLKLALSMLTTLQLLGGASLAASVVGVGVSAAGFALVLNRLDRLGRALEEAHQDVRRVLTVAERSELRALASGRGEVDSLLYRAEEAWGRSDAERVWRELDGPLDRAHRCARRLVEGSGAPVFLDGRFSLQEAAATYEMTSTLAAARVRLLLLLEERDAASRFASDVARWHDELLTRFDSAAIAGARSAALAREVGVSESEARGKLLTEGRQLHDAVCEAQTRLAGRCALVRLLAQKGLTGREYVEGLRQRDDVPLLVLDEP